MVRFVGWIKGLFQHEPIKLAIVRRYEDANGSYVGELYIEQTVKGVTAYNMIGASLDTLPFDFTGEMQVGEFLDLKHDFLASMPEWCVRVGALDPKDNDHVREMVAKMPRRRMTLVVQNRFFMEPIVRLSGKGAV